MAVFALCINGKESIRYYDDNPLVTLLLVKRCFVWRALSISSKLIRAQVAPLCPVNRYFPHSHFLQKGIAYDLYASGFCFLRVAGGGVGVFEGASLAVGAAGDS